MNLHIRDPRAHELARQLAERRGVSMTTAVIDALRAELERLQSPIGPERRPLAERLEAIADRLAAKAGPRGRDLTKDEITEMWGDP